MTRPAERLSPDRQLSRQDIDCLKEAFKLFDCDRDGEITVSELGKVGTAILDTHMYWQQWILMVFSIPQLLIAQCTMGFRHKVSVLLCFDMFGLATVGAGPVGSTTRARPSQPSTHKLFHNFFSFFPSASNSATYPFETSQFSDCREFVSVLAAWDDS